MKSSMYRIVRQSLDTNGLCDCIFDSRLLLLPHTKHVCILDARHDVFGPIKKTSGEISRAVVAVRLRTLVCIFCFRFVLCQHLVPRMCARDRFDIDRITMCNARKYAIFREQCHQFKEICCASDQG